MTEIERIIYRMSAWELEHFASIGGVIPAAVIARRVDDAATLEEIAEMHAQIAAENHDKRRGKKARRAEAA